MNKSVVNPKPEIKAGNLIMTLSNGKQVKIDLDAIEHLFEWNAAKHCDELLLSISQVNAYLLMKQEDINLKELLGYTPKPDNLYFLNMIAEALKGKQFFEK
jgi:hypothetical protein